MFLSLLFLASFTLTWLPLSQSYRDGARSESCYNMLVMHTDFLGQFVSPGECGSSCQYQLRMVGKVVGENSLAVEEFDSTTYQCGEVYQLQLLGDSSSTFEGFMVEARENTSSFEKGSTIWGTWVTDPNNLYHAVECNRSNSSSDGPFENAATQNSPADLTSLILYWRAPPPPNTTEELQQLPEKIKFWFVTVQQRLTYVYPVEGPVLERGCTLDTLSSSPSLEFSHTPSPSPLAYSTSYMSLSSSTSSSIPMSPLYSPNFSSTPTFSTSLNTTSISTDTGGEPLAIGVIVGPVLSVLLLIIAVTVTVIIVTPIVVHYKKTCNRVAPEAIKDTKTVIYV